MRCESLNKVLYDLKMIRENNERKRKEVLREIFTGGHLIRIPKAILVGILICIVILVLSFLLLPFNYLFWSIYNRKNIPVWLIILFDLIIIALTFQFYVLFGSLSTGFLFHIGILLCFIAGFEFNFFMITRHTLLSSELKKITELTKKLAVGLFGFMNLFLMSMCIILFMLAYSVHHNNSFLLFSTETTILLWVVLMEFILFKYPEDAVITKIKLYELRLWNWVKADSGKDK